jgi:hypothetical protein
VTPQAVVWLALDEALGDVVRRFKAHGATRDIVLVTDRPSEEQLENLVRESCAGLVVVDTLSEYAGPSVRDFNSVSQWQPLLSDIRKIAQGTGAGFLLLHHVAKATGRPRDSSAIPAGVDQIVEMPADAADRSVRRCSCRGRIPTPDFAIRYTEGRYDLTGGNKFPLERRVLEAVGRQPGIGKRRLREAVGGNAEAVDRQIDELLAGRKLVNRGSSRVSAFFLADEET